MKRQNQSRNGFNNLFKISTPKNNANNICIKLNGVF